MEFRRFCACDRHAIVCLGVVGTVDALLDFWNFFLFGFAQQQLVRNLRVDVFRAIIRRAYGAAALATAVAPGRPTTISGLLRRRQEIAFFDVTPTGDLVSRLAADTAEMGNDLTCACDVPIIHSSRITAGTGRSPMRPFARALRSVVSSADALWRAAGCSAGRSSASFASRVSPDTCANAQPVAARVLPGAGCAPRETACVT
jgi:ABC-type multidrug transport system fused ATPase/permease subunit